MSSTDTEGLVERLRDDAVMNEEVPIKSHLWDTAKLECEAANELERMKAEIESRADDYHAMTVEYEERLRGQEQEPVGLGAIVDGEVVETCHLADDANPDGFREFWDGYPKARVVPLYTHPDSSQEANDGTD